MGRFEIILVLIGIVWTVVSAVAQKKAKAAKMASLQADDPVSMLLGEEEEEEEQFVEEAQVVEVDLSAPARKSAFKELRERRLAQLRSRSRLASPGGAAAGAPIRVPPPPPAAATPVGKVLLTEKSSKGELPPIDEHDHEQPSRRPSSKKNPMSLKFREALGDKQRVREAILLKEILGKPLSIRGISRS